MADGSDNLENNIENTNNYVLQTLIPKKHTQADLFVNENDTYDGRGVIIGIWDTGVDPCAPGLQVTVDGKPKVIDMVDTSGSGDVDTSITRKISEDSRTIVGLTGRSIDIPSEWNPVGGCLHVGIKPAFDVFPEQLRSRLLKEFREKRWAPEIRRLTAEVAAMMEAFDKDGSLHSKAPKDKLAKENLHCLEECLSMLDKKFTYMGPVFDCLVFDDQSNWVACVDTSPYTKESLASQPLMASFKVRRDYRRFGDSDMMNYGVNIYDNGNLLEIVTNSGSHGTHVSAIAAAHFPESPEKNGAAPGAQVISFKISDTRLSGMETGTALMRAAIKTIETKCDIVNFSFGEATHSPNNGRVCEMMTELVLKHGIVFCSSSGNNGPALSTVGCPGGTTDGILGIAPFVFPDMMEVDYSMSKSEHSSPYTWASRGPSTDGATGMIVGAPGGAITSVANWTLKGSQLMNGSSMSSPSACGGIALVLSALKQSNLPYSPLLISQAVANTAKPLAGYDPLSQGQGCLQVAQAFDYCKTYAERLSSFAHDSSSSCKTNSGGNNSAENCLTKEMVAVPPAHLYRIKMTVMGGARGILIREPHVTEDQRSYNINVQPEFNEDLVPGSLRIRMQLHLSIECDAPWVQCPKYITLMNQERCFVVHVDPSSLPQDGQHHYTELTLSNPDMPHLGPLARLPITLIKPLRIPAEGPFELSFKSTFGKENKIHRHFIAVPNGATAAYMTVQTTNRQLEQSVRFVLHCIQLSPAQHYKVNEVHRVLQLGGRTNEQTLAFRVTGGRTMELCLAQAWNSAESGVEVAYTIRFHGVEPNYASIVLHSAEAFTRLTVKANLTREEISPAINLTHWVLPIRPSDNKMRCLSSERDRLPQNRNVYALQLTYHVTVHKSSDLTFSFPLLNDLLYENDFQSQLWMLFDNNKRYLTAGDYNPSEYSAKLEKGEYTLQLQLRHEKKEMLDRHRDMTLLAQHKQSNSLQFEVASSLSNLSAGKKFFSGVVLRQATLPIYIGMPSEEKYPKTVVTGSYFQGTISFYKDEALKKAVTYPFKMIVSELVSKKNISPPPPSTPQSTSSSAPVAVATSPSSPEKNSEQTVVTSSTQDSEAQAADCASSSFCKTSTGKCKLEDMQEAVDQLRISWINKLGFAEQKGLFEELSEKLGESHVALLHARIQGLEIGSEEDRIERLQLLCQLAPRLLEIWDTKQLAQFVASKNSDFPLPAGKSKGDMEKQRQNVVDLLARYGTALCDLVESDAPTTATSTSVEPGAADTSWQSLLDSVAIDLSRWQDKPEPASSVGQFMVRYAGLKGHHGRALKLLLKMNEEKPSRDFEEKIIKTLKKLGWDFIAESIQDQLPIRYPNQFRLF